MNVAERKPLIIVKNRQPTGGPVLLYFTVFFIIIYYQNLPSHGIAIEGP